MTRINLQGPQQQGLDVSLVLCHRGQVVQGDHILGPQPGTRLGVGAAGEARGGSRSMGGKGAGAGVHKD